MKKVMVLLSALIIQGSVLFAHPLGFKICLYNTSVPPSVNSLSSRDSFLLRNMGGDLILASEYEGVYNWCKDICNDGGSVKTRFGTTCPVSGGYKGWSWYTTGLGLVGRYVDWRTCADSLALGQALIGLLCDTLSTQFGNNNDENAFANYRIFDGDSGYLLGTSRQFAFRGAQLLYDSLKEDDDKLKGNRIGNNSHYIYYWGSLDYPQSLDYYLDILKDVDVAGPGCYPFNNVDTSTQKALHKAIEGCRKLARSMNARGKAYMPLIQCGRDNSKIVKTINGNDTIIDTFPSRAPTRTQLRAISWISLAYGSTWLGYYTYRGWSSLTSAADTINFTGAAGIVGKESDSKPFITTDSLNWLKANDSVWGDYTWDNYNVDNVYLNLYRVIQEIKLISPTLANLTWVDGFSKSELPRGWVKEVSGISSGDSADFGMFTHDESGDPYLMVVNRNTTSNKSLTLKLTPGPGHYTITDVAKDSVIRVANTDSSGILDTFTVSNIPPGGGVLLHLDRASFTDTLSSNDPNATAGYNGRKIVADKFGGLHVVYTTKSGDTSKVWYAYRNTPYTSLTSGWSKILVVSNASTPSLAVDCYGNPFITYRKGDSIKVSNLSKDVKVMNGTSAPSIAVDGAVGKGVIAVERSGSIYTRPFNLVDLSFPESENLLIGNAQYPSVVLGKKTVSSNAFYLTFDPPKDNTGLYRWMRSSSLNGNWTAIIATNYPSGDVPSIDALYSSNRDMIVYRNNNSIRSCIGADTATNIGTGNGTVESDEGLFAAWSNTGTQIKCAYNNNGTWAGERTLFSGTYAAYPHTAISWYHGKAYVFATVKSGANYSLWLTDSISAGNFEIDSVRVINPNGPPQPDHEGPPYSFPFYILGNTINVAWHLKKDEADTSYVYANYNYNPSLPNDGWELIATKAGNDTTYAWKTTKAGSKCRVKVKVKYDNQYPYDISNANFEIRDFSVKLPQYTLYKKGENNTLSYTPASSSKTISWEIFSTGGLSSVDLLVSRDGGASFTSYADSSTYDSTLTDTIIDGNDTSYAYTYIGVTWWTTPFVPTSNGCLKVMAMNDDMDTAYSDLFDGFIIAPPGGFKSNTYSNQRLFSSNNDGDKLGLVYTARDPEDTTKLNVLYMESSDGIDFTAPDTIKQGRWPAFSNGACMWKNAPTYCTKDTMWYSYQLNDTFSTPISTASIDILADSGRFAPVGILSENDTIHSIIQLTRVQKSGDVTYFTPAVVYVRFRESLPGSPYVDTIKISTSALASYYDTSQVAGSLAKRGSTIYAAYDYLSNCYFTTITPPNHLEKNMGLGSQPQVTPSEGNIVYTYLASGDTSIIRMCRYVDDTTWFRKDTLFLDDGAEFLYDERGLMYGVQDKDTALSHLYVYDPLSKEFYLTQTYQGYYPHPYVDNESSAFSWITAYANKVDSTTTYLHTERQDMNVIIPALYLEAADKRSPYTTFRDTCVHYTAADVDSGTDSLKYTFPHLDDSKNYSAIIEFYNDADTLDSLQITLGSEVDTIVIPANAPSWYEQNIAANTDTMNLKIARISANGYVPVSRVIVRQRSETGLFMMKGKPVIGPEKIVFCLFQPNPNPFSDAATIRYSLPYETNVSLKVYDISGRLVNTLVQGKVQAGVHTIRWEGKDSINRKCSSGVYFVRFVAADYRASKKMVMLK